MGIPNQFRTLLLNVDGSNAPHPNYPGEEFVIPTFKAVPLSGDLTVVRRTLFGINPDRAMLNYRLRELMSIVHTSELAGFVYALDPRVTYWPPSNDSIFNTTVQGFQIVQLQGSLATINVLGQSGIVTDGEILYYTFLVTVTDATHVTVHQTAGGSYNVTSTYTTSGGISSPVPLAQTGINVTFVPEVGAQWQITWLATPSRDLAAIDNNLRSVIGGEVKTALFGSNPGEPFLTLLNLYEDNLLMPYRVGAVAVALAYQTNAVLEG